MDQELKNMLDDMGRTYNEFKGTHGTLMEEVKKLNTRDAVLEESIKKITDDFAQKHEALQKAMDALETKAKRPIAAPSELEAEAKSRRDYLDMKAVQSMRKGQPIDTSTVEVTPDEMAAFQLYGRVFAKAMRFDAGREMSRFTQDELKALSIGTDADGGLLIRPEWSARIQTRVYESSPLRQLATIETISTTELKMPVDIAEADAGWVGEKQTRSETSTPTVSETAIVAHEMYALAKATSSLLEDGAINVEQWLSNKIADKFSRVEATAFVNGNGVNKPRGILSYAAGTTWGQIQQVASGTSGSFTVAGLTNIVASLKEVYQPRAQWMIRRESIAAIMLLTDPEGHYIFQPILANGYNNMPLLGYPIRYAYDIPTAAADSLSAVFGDFGAAYTIVDRLGITTLRDAYMYKPFVGFYSRKRVGGAVTDFDAIKILKLANS